MQKRRRLSDEFIFEMRDYYRANPSVSFAHVSRIFGVSTMPVYMYLSDIKAGVEKPLPIIRKEWQNKDKTKRCTKCSSPRSSRSQGLCKSCFNSFYRRDESVSRGGSFQRRAIILENCDPSPTQYHHYMMDRWDKGICKYCEQSQQFIGELDIPFDCFTNASQRELEEIKQ